MRPLSFSYIYPATPSSAPRHFALAIPAGQSTAKQSALTQKVPTSQTRQRSGTDLSFHFFFMLVSVCVCVVFELGQLTSVGAGIVHFVLCVGVQWVIGRQIEKTAGWLRVLLVYFIAGIGGYLFSGMLAPEQANVGSDPAVVGLLAGASRLSVGHSCLTMIYIYIFFPPSCVRF